MTKLYSDKSLHKIPETTIEDFFQGKVREDFEKSLSELREKNKQIAQNPKLGNYINIKIIF